LRTSILIGGGGEAGQKPNAALDAPREEEERLRERDGVGLPQKVLRLGRVSRPKWRHDRRLNGIHFGPTIMTELWEKGPRSSRAREKDVLSSRQKSILVPTQD